MAKPQIRIPTRALALAGLSGAWSQHFLSMSLYSPERVAASLMTFGSHFGSDVVKVLAREVGSDDER